jgi:hypothetical protein
VGLRAASAKYSAISRAVRNCRRELCPKKEHYTPRLRSVLLRHCAQLNFLQVLRNKLLESVLELPFDYRRSLDPKECLQAAATPKVLTCFSAHPHASYSNGSDDDSDFVTDDIHNLFSDSVRNNSSNRRIIAHCRSGKLRQLLPHFGLGILNLLRNSCQRSTASGGIAMCKACPSVTIYCVAGLLGDTPSP